jgi:uncharacterized protein (DUF58 family)
MGWNLSRFLRRSSVARDGWARIQRGQIYILPTAYGVLFGVLLLVMLVGSVNYASNLGFLVTFLLTGLGLVAMLHTWRNLLGLRVGTGRAPAVFAGQSACYEVLLDNPDARERPAIVVQVDHEKPAAKDLDRLQRASVEVCRPAERRGQLPLGRLRIETRFPLGLLRAWSYVDLDLLCLVYPRPAPRGEPPQAPDYSHNQEGDRGVGADDFVALRPYRSGDSLRRIDWKALARERGLLSKQFGGDRAQKIWLDWESLPDIDTESRLSLLCRFVLLASEQGHAYGLRLPALRIPPGRDGAHRHRCLAALACYPSSP